MTFTACDKCGMPDAPVLILPYTKAEMPELQRYDLCLGCLRRLIAWMGVRERAAYASDADAQLPPTP